MKGKFSKENIQNESEMGEINWNYFQILPLTFV